jgi:hypothetical protein
MILSHGAVATVAFLFGVDRTRKAIEREIMDVLNEHQKTIEEEVKKFK